MKPTLHLTNWASRAQHGPGARWCAMARPRRWEHGDGNVLDATPFEDDLDAVLGRLITIDEYTDRCKRRWTVRAEWGRYKPGGALQAHRRRPNLIIGFPVRDGDTLLCACPRRGSPRWSRPCHLESLAPFLVRAGWRVLLYGEEVTC